MGKILMYKNTSTACQKSLIGCHRTHKEIGYCKKGRKPLFFRQYRNRAQSQREKRHQRKTILLKADSLELLGLPKHAQ